MTFCYCDYSCGTMVRDSTIHAAHTEGVLSKFGQKVFTFILILDRSRTLDRKKPVVSPPLPSYTPNCGITSKQSHLRNHPQPYEPLTSTHTKICHHLFSVTSSLSSPANSILQGSASSSHKSCQMTAVITLTRCLSSYHCFTVVV